MPGESDAKDDKVIQKAFGPAAEEFGKEIQPLGKEVGERTVAAVRSVLVGYDNLVWGFDRIREFLVARISQRIKDVPLENIRPPNPRVAAPAIQALTYSAGDEEIRDMFANLIAADLDARMKSATHPSFVEMLKQMSSEDAKAFRAIAATGGRHILYSERVYRNKDGADRNHFIPQEFLVTFAAPGLDFDRALHTLSSLERLGLIRLTEGVFPVTGELMKQIEDFKKTDEYTKWVAGLGEARHTGHHTGISLSPLGQDFAKVCL